jgi:cell division septation protein DedD
VFKRQVQTDAGARDSDRAAAAPAPTPPAPRDTAVRRPVAGYTVSFAALLEPGKARDLAAQIRVGTENARVVTAVRDGSTIYRVVLGPYPTREDADRIGRESKQSYWIYEGGP